jgi:hypothetical protein
MTAVTVECLDCGWVRTVPHERGHVDAGVCPCCGYVGWALASELTERARRQLRARPLDRRRARLVA